MPQKPAKPALLVIAAASTWFGNTAHAAGEAGGGRSLALVPTLSVTQILTDNHLLSETGRSDGITQVAAGVGLRASSNAVQGLVDYSLTGSLHARHSSRNQVQNALTANASAELVDNRLQLNASARISQAAVSAFGAQPGTGVATTANSTEVRTLQVTPTLRGQVGPWMQYSASLSHAMTVASGGSNGDSSTTSVTVRVEPRTRSRLGWSVDASHQA